MEQERNSPGLYDYPGATVFTLTTPREDYLARRVDYLERKVADLEFTLFIGASDFGWFPFNRNYNDFLLKQAHFPPPEFRYSNEQVPKATEGLINILSQLDFADWIDPFPERLRVMPEEIWNLSEPPFLKKKSLLEYVSLQHGVVVSERVYKENKFFPEEGFIMRRKSGGSYYGTTRRLSFINLAAALTWFVADAGTVYSVRVRELPIASPIRPTAKHPLRDLRVRRGNCRRKSGTRGK